MNIFLKALTLSLSTLAFFSPLHAFFPLMFVDHREEDQAPSSYKQFNLINKDGHVVSLMRHTREEEEGTPAINSNLPLSEEHFKKGWVWFGINQFTQSLEMDFLNSLGQSWEEHLPYDLQVQNQERLPLSSESAMEFWQTHKRHLLLDKNSSEIRHTESGALLGYFSHLTAPVKWFFSERTPRIVITAQEAPAEQRQKWEALAKLNYRCSRSTGFGMNEQNYEEALASFEGTPPLASDLSNLSPEEKSLLKASLFLKTQFQLLKFFEILKNPSASLKKDLNDHFDTIIANLKERKTFETQSLQIDVNQSITSRFLLAFHILKVDISETVIEKEAHKKEIEQIFSSIGSDTQPTVLLLAHPDMSLRFVNMAGLFAQYIPSEVYQSHRLFTEIPLSERDATRLSPLHPISQIKIGTGFKVSSLLSSHISLFSGTN
ncbi:MAG: hypothetical protein B7Y25_06195 [Alphaproteobacteria bacterium 16-39-46]|nr:MAG: hypothetical protein B7Y25_06195 [Alphaproteobacteria bacterium 16-39-46]OZA42367.1 MAG: hypothetical protein B7X84_06265 [Alphaproteobacteria bacterium 17-39-52]HQS84504.1 hypothetical protein [Alphaproteobacteria bacterium]HQS94285.1 hypothetical protein [Alphaproteobacteria bacterium]